MSKKAEAEASAAEQFASAWGKPLVSGFKLVYPIARVFPVKQEAKFGLLRNHLQRQMLTLIASLVWCFLLG